MPWLLLLRSPWTYVVIAFAALGAYAAVQHIGWQAAESRYVTLEAETTRLAAEAKVKNALQAAQQARNAQEALDDLQTRLNRTGALYASLRSHPGSSGMSQAGTGAAIPSPGPVGALQPDPDPGCLAAFEWADIQLAKYAELWRLQEANAAD